MISSIVHIAHEYDDESNPWPIQIEDHDGVLHTVNLAAGQVEILNCYFIQFRICVSLTFLILIFVWYVIDAVLWECEMSARSHERIPRQILRVNFPPLSTRRQINLELLSRGMSLYVSPIYQWLTITFVIVCIDVFYLTFASLWFLISVSARLWCCVGRDRVCPPALARRREAGRRKRTTLCRRGTIVIVVLSIPYTA